MGRYFQHRLFPDADFEIPAAFTEIPQSEVRFHASGGPHLYGFRVVGTNTSGAAFDFNVRVRLDGVAVVGSGYGETVPIGADFTAHAVRLLEVPAGDHTLSLEVSGTGVAGETVNLQTCWLWAIELNPQEVSDRIE